MNIRNIANLLNSGLINLVEAEQEIANINQGSDCCYYMLIADSLGVYSITV